ncbi:MAG: FHA domain-containing protein, partial [Oscillibacter sp.]|nr:FHA domain-containing protein [Oscillibacter sp.]
MKRVSDAIVRTLAVMLCVWMVTGTAAAEGPEILEQKVTEDSVVLYVPYKGEAGAVQVKIGQTDVSARVGEENPEVITWMLYDNSLSIGTADREKAKSIFTDYFGKKIPTEKINLCTFDEKLNRLTTDSNDTIDLPNKMQAVEHADQETYLTDVLAEVLSIENQRQGTQYIRILVFSDGVDNNPKGITREELMNRLKDQNIPIYTIGCGTDDAALKNMYSISRQTGGKEWELSNLDTTNFAPVFRYNEAPAVVRVSIPKELQDGSVRAVQLTMPDGSLMSSQVQMPFGNEIPDIPDPPDPPDPPIPPEPPKSNVLLIVLIVLLSLILVAGIVVGIVLLVKNRAKNNRVVPINSGGRNWGPGGGNWNPSGGGSSGGSSTDIMDGGDDGYESGATAILVGDDSSRMLILSDLDNPARHFEAPMRDRVSIGRGGNNRIVLDYDRSVSGNHCEIYNDGSAYRIRDLNSSNGTFVEGMRVADTAEISNGSTIRLGRLNFRVN